MISRKEKAAGAVVSIVVATGLTWYAAMDGGIGIGNALLFWLMVSGLMWGMSLCIMDETQGRNPVIASFLGRRLLKPLEERRWEKWREQGCEMGRAEARAEIRKRLEELGLEPHEMLPGESPKKTDDEG